MFDLYTFFISGLGCLISTFLLLVYYVMKERENFNLPNIGRQFTFGNTIHFMFMKSRARGVPLTTLTFEMFCGMAHLLEDEGMCLARFGSRNILLLYSPETVEKLLSSKSEIDKGTTYKPGEKFLGGGLLVSTGDKWRRNRKVLTPSFHFKILEEYLPIMNEQSRVLITKLKNSVDKKEPYVDMTKMATLCTFDIILETSMGSTLDAQNDENCSVLASLTRVMDMWVQLMIMPFSNIDFIFNLLPIAGRMRKHVDVIHSFTKNVITSKKTELFVNNNVPLPSTPQDYVRERKDSLTNMKSRLSFLDLLLSHQMTNGSFYTDHDVIGETLLFVIAGHDTTAIALSWSLFMLGHHPDVQEKLYEEIRSIFGDDRTTPITPAHLRSMKYLECVAKESQRIYPSIPYVSRKLKENMVINGKLIPKKTTCMIMIDLIHKNQRMYPDPLKFDPDRFLPENSVGRHPYAYIPFSAGPRNCIGQKFAMMEEKILVADIIRNFKVKSLDPRDKFFIIPQVVGKPSREVRLKFTLRETSDKDFVHVN